VSIPLIHIADATALAVQEAGIGVPGPLGTRFTMEDGFYQKHLQESHALQIKIPELKDRAFVYQATYEELCQGILKEGTRAEFRRITQGMVQGGADGIIVGCTELGSLVRVENVNVPVFDATKIHAQAAVDYACQMPSDPKRNQLPQNVLMARFGVLRESRANRKELNNFVFADPRRRVNKIPQ
jgi:aspartate racemase